MLYVVICIYSQCRKSTLKITGVKISVQEVYWEHQAFREECWLTRGINKRWTYGCAICLRTLAEKVNTVITFFIFLNNLAGKKKIRTNISLANALLEFSLLYWNENLDWLFLMEAEHSTQCENCFPSLAVRTWRAACTKMVQNVTLPAFYPSVQQ